MNWAWLVMSLALAVCIGHLLTLAAIRLNLLWRNGSGYMHCGSLGEGRIEAEGIGILRSQAQGPILSESEDEIDYLQRAVGALALAMLADHGQDPFHKDGDGWDADEMFQRRMESVRLALERITEMRFRVVPIPEETPHRT